MSTLLLALSLFAEPVPDDYAPLQGTWTSGAGTVLIIDSDVFSINKNGKEEFAGFVGIPKSGTLQLIVRGEVALEVPYKVASDKLTLTIDGTAVEYTRKPIKEGKG